MTDPRYRITLEHCGHARPMYVLRFCDDFVSSHRFKRQAIAAMVEHRRYRTYVRAA